MNEEKAIIPAERKKICDSCKDKKGFICGVCGCVISLKVIPKNQKCPIDKW
jgi:hypothetical protein